ncbi:MAG: efflux RND transporter periplasmic adaptor subunit [Candidatus Pacebacteria bacterium]|nr:efflux RND transporter periplasmic adaptor subunit [Candidatus Paceibacterota bacterium]
MAEENTQQEEVMEENAEATKSRVPLMVAAAIILVLGGGIGCSSLLGVESNRVYIEKSAIDAPSIPLAPTTSGTLQQVYVSVGDTIAPNTVVAEVGTQLIKSTIGGLVISTDTDIGSLVSTGTPVVTMIDPTQLQVDGQLEEDKGLADVAVGDRAIFTVDAFPGKTFTGVVSEVSPTSHASDVVFQVSDQRQEQNFDVKVAYDITKYPELRNGMSAKIWVYKN